MSLKSSVSLNYNVTESPSSYTFCSTPDSAIKVRDPLPVFCSGWLSHFLSLLFKLRPLVFLLLLCRCPPVRSRLFQGSAWHFPQKRGFFSFPLKTSPSPSLINAELIGSPLGRRRARLTDSSCSFRLELVKCRKAASQRWHVVDRGWKLKLKKSDMFAILLVVFNVSHCNTEPLWRVSTEGWNLHFVDQMITFFFCF